MKKIFAHTAIIFIVFTIAMLPQSEKASASGNINFTYSPKTGYLSGDLFTSERLTRIELYVTDGYDFEGDKTIYMRNTATGTIFYLQGSNVQCQSSQEESFDIVYGGIVPVTEYSVNCLIYYIVSESTTPISWKLDVLMDQSLREIFVTKSVVPADWQTSSANPVITKPTAFCLGFIRSNASAYTSKDIRDILFCGAVDVEVGNFSGEIIEPEEADPIKNLLIVLIGATIIAIIVTGILIKKEKARSEQTRSENFVKKANAKVKAKKSKENDELKDLISSYDDDYADDVPSPVAPEPAVPVNYVEPQPKSPEPIPQIQAEQRDASWQNPYIPSQGIVPATSLPPAPAYSYQGYEQQGNNYTNQQSVGYNNFQQPGPVPQAQQGEPLPPKRIPAFARRD